MKLYTHLNFGGNCEEAFRFYEKQLGGKITMMMKQSQMPPQVKAPPGSANAIIHARMNIAGVELIGNDVPPITTNRYAAHTCTSPSTPRTPRRRSMQCLRKAVRSGCRSRRPSSLPVLPSYATGSERCGQSFISAPCKPGMRHKGGDAAEP